MKSYSITVCDSTKPNLEGLCEYQHYIDEKGCHLLWGRQYTSVTPPTSNQHVWIHSGSLSSLLVWGRRLPPSQNSAIYGHECKCAPALFSTGYTVCLVFSDHWWSTLNQNVIWDLFTSRSGHCFIFFFSRVNANFTWAAIYAAAPLTQSICHTKFIMNWKYLKFQRIIPHSCKADYNSLIYSILKPHVNWYEQERLTKQDRGFLTENIYSFSAQTSMFCLPLLHF